MKKSETKYWIQRQTIKELDFFRYRLEWEDVEELYVKDSHLYKRSRLHLYKQANPGVVARIVRRTTTYETTDTPWEYS